MYKVECDRIRLSAGPALKSGVKEGRLSRARWFHIFRYFSRGGYHQWWEINNRKVGRGCDKIERGGGIGQMSRQCVQELIHSRVGDQWLWVGEADLEGVVVRNGIGVKREDLLTRKYHSLPHPALPGRERGLTFPRPLAQI